MRRVPTMLMLLGTLVATTGIARATDKDKFDSLVGKYALELPFGSLPTSFRPKSACYCSNPSAGIPNAAGFVVREVVGDLTYVNCYFPYFNADGSLQTYGYCNEFQVLAK